MTTHLDDRSNPGDGAEAERPDSGGVPGDPPAGEAAGDQAKSTAPPATAPPTALPTTAAPTAGAVIDADDWDQPPAAPLRTPMPTQSAVSRLGDVLVSPFGRHRRETMVVLSLVILALLVWVALTELLVAPGASQSILS